ncbi:MAG: C4-dicarboxylate ABC transporter permease [Firmicutes bacterium HGW-Firmicutes-11]|jgi:tripartite ATP-independent transporter DctM subunit|nr:MAG: C4-dicarboxylate ABC transporter permease [Firmicutes bacterium HGW-Firmicutes-11]
MILKETTQMWELSSEMTGVVGIITLFVLVFLKVPIGFSLFLVGTVGYGLVVSPQAALAKLGTDPFNNVNNYTLSVIPMFTFMGMLLGNTGLGRDLFVAFNAILGRFRGGLAMATVATCAAFASVSGSVIATTATIAPVAVPEMRRSNYQDSLAAGVVAAGSTLGILIPPSSNLVIYGMLTEESIGQLLIAGIFPGLMTALFMIITVFIMVRVKPELAPNTVRVDRAERNEAFKKVWPIPFIFIVSMGGILIGLFTATEGGAFGAFLAFVVSLATRRCTLKGLKDSLYGTARITGMLMIFIIGGITFGNFISVSRIPSFLQVYLLELPPVLLMLTIFAIFFVSGFFMDAMAALIIFTSLFYPIVIAAGFSGIWYGIITILMILIGFLTPPVGVVAIVTSGLTKIKLETVFKGTIPFWFALMAAALVLIVFPGIATFLPSLMIK